MSIKTRLELYKKLEEKRGNPLIVYVTSQRMGARGGMAADVIDQIIDQIEALPSGKKEIDFLIESTGGDGLVSWRAISLLRSVVDKINILVPHSAFSAATLLSLGGDEIIMGKYGCLGPIDPQITITKKDGTTQQFAYEDIVAFINFAQGEVGLTEQEYKESAFKILCETVEPSALGFSNRSSKLSVSIAEKLLQSHMSTAEEKARAKTIADNLNKKFFNHSHALGRDDAKSIGLNVKEPEKNVEKLMWEIHKDFEEDFQTRKAFNPLSEFLSESGAEIYLQSPPPLNISSSINQQLLIQIVQQHIQTQLDANVPEVIREIKHAAVESLRVASQFISKNKIIVSRTPDLNFTCNMIQLKSSWDNIDVEDKKKSEEGESSSEK
ncbi:MAG TPA: hypothetical protein PKU93_00560 [Candidatus Pacearchaeota archaeon]|nr:hypothetical protein [Candidatus Pacearchaeota archaeon]